IIYIVSNGDRPVIQGHGYPVHFLVQKNDIHKDHIACLQLLDVLLLLRKLPDESFSFAVNQYKDLLVDLSHEEKRLLTRLSRKYPPCVRATLALTLHALSEKSLSIKIMETLSPVVINRY